MVYFVSAAAAELPGQASMKKYVTLPAVALCTAMAVSAPTPVHAGETITYSYDSRGRLTTVARTGTVDNMTASYSFDGGDNRTNVNYSGVTGGGTTPYPNVVGEGEPLPESATVAGAPNGLNSEPEQATSESLAGATER